MDAMQRFHRDENAQVSFLALAAVICFVALLAMVINTNDVIEERVHMQNVADSMVLSSAAWSARGLNLVSFVNVMNTKLVTMAVLLNAMKEALPVIIKVGEIQRAGFAACQGVPFVGIVCTIMYGVTTVQLAILRVAKGIVTPAANTLAKCKSGGLWKITKALQAAAKGVKNTFVGFAAADSYDIAIANGASFGLTVNGRLLKKPAEGLTLPVIEGSVPKLFCPKMKNGGSGYKLEGYACSGDERAPLPLGQDRQETMLYPFINFGAHFIFRGFVSKNMVQVGCVPLVPDEPFKTKVQLSDLGECREYKAIAKWNRTASSTGQVTEANWTVDDFIPWKPLTNSGGKDTSKAEDLLKGLGGLDTGGLPTGGGGDLPPPNFKDGYQALDPATERTGKEFGVACSVAPYPPHAGFTWVTSAGVKSQINNRDLVGGYFIKVEKIKQPTPEPEPKKDAQGEEVLDAEGKPVLITPPQMYVYNVTTITLTSAGEKEMDEKEFDEYYKKKDIPKSSDSEKKDEKREACDTPKPWKLQKLAGYEDRLRFIGVVYKDIEDNPPFWSTFFAAPPKKIIAYAQAQVYNHLSDDMFTQDWRVRLERANLLESFLEKRGSEAGVNTSKPKADQGNVFSNTLKKVNNH